MALGELFHICSGAVAIPVPAGKTYTGIGTAFTAIRDGDVAPVEVDGLDHVLSPLFFVWISPGNAKSADVLRSQNIGAGVTGYSVLEGLSTL